ncbi:PEP-utilizing enzyme [Actinomycetospora flava]|uniref:PEP-utilizing enzyme n=1 Tax=Actinomycetospora flava TaxID=3129232 RepID=A0ABU8M9W4_9PSEU
MTETAAGTVIGRGTSAYTSPEVVEGPVRWLDSPDAVLDLVGSGRIGEYIAISRGGTTTFMAPALAAGVRGLLTLQGMPTSHLGILSREFGIPCLMSVTFTDGVRTERGETVPADDTVVRLDISRGEGAVLLG